MKSKQLRKLAKAERKPYRAYLRLVVKGDDDALALAARRVMRLKGMR